MATSVMIRFRHCWLSGFALCATLSLWSADDLRLVGEVDGKRYPFAGVEEGELLLQDGGRNKPAPLGTAWHLEGDLHAHADLVHWAPDQTIARLPEGKLNVEPDKPIEAEVRFRRPLSQNVHLMGTAVISAWLMDGQVHDTLVSTPGRRSISEGEIRIGFRFRLNAEEHRGQGVHLVWTNGHWLAPEPLFANDMINDALIAFLFDDAESLTGFDASLLGEKSREKLTLVHYAADAGSSRILSRLANEHPRALQQEDQHRASLIHRAARNGRTSAVRALIAANISPAAENKFGDTPLELAIQLGHRPVVEELLASKALPRRRADRASTIGFAIAGGFTDIAQALRAAGADFDFKSHNATRQLLRQAEEGNMAMVAWLAEQGVDVNYRDTSAFVLLTAATKGSGETAEALIAAGADPKKTRDNGFSPLMAAAEAGNAPFARALIAAGAEVDGRLESGATALHIAAHANAVDVVTLLLEGGADINATNNQDLTPLDAALFNGSGSAARRLAQRGARIDLGSAHSHKLLEAALRWDVAEPLAAALEEGWPADSTFAGIWPAVRLAQIFGAKECEALLLQAGAKVEPDRPVPLASAHELDERLRVARAVMPTDPRPASESFPEHIVRIEIIVDQEGRPLFPKIVSADDPRLGAAVLKDIAQWRFSPPRRGGQPVATQAVLPLNFAASTDRVFELTELNEMPRPIVRKAPVYPFVLKRNGVQGQVTVVFVVDTEGIPTDLRVEQSTDSRFEQAAIDAVAEWRFEPGRVAGRPVATRVRQTLEFTIF